MDQQVHFSKIKTDQSQEVIEITEIYNTELQSCDPLAGVAEEVRLPQYYRVDCVVFAEPLNNRFADGAHEEKGTPVSVDSTRTLNENVSVRKRLGKGKNLFVHLQDQSKLSCPVPNCSKSFQTPPLLRTHIRKVHYSERNHTCEVCGASFTAQYLLKRHLAVHGAKRVQCPVCMKMLSLRTNLSQHLRSHSDTRRHQCPVCNKRFLRSSTLKIHQKKTHKDAK